MPFLSRMWTVLISRLRYGRVGHFGLVSLGCLGWVGMEAVVRADPPVAAYIFPAGGQRGTTVHLRIGGQELHETCPFEMLGAGVDASPALQRAQETRWFEGPVVPLPDSQAAETYPTDYSGTVAIAQTAQVGYRRWRVWTSQGVTETRKFEIGDLPEIVEQEIDGNPIPEAVRLPVTVNGRIFPREDEDVWSFECAAGTNYTCIVNALQLGSPLEARLFVTDPDGRSIVESVASSTADPRLAFKAERNGVYQIHIHDANFGGLQSYVYRLTITGGPFVETVYPLGGQRGSTIAVHATGQNLGDGPFPLTLPQTTESFWLQPLPVGSASSNLIAWELGDWNERLEQEPNDVAADSPMLERSVVLPGCVLNGRIQRAGDLDLWGFEAKSGDAFSFEVHAARLGSRLDSIVSVRNEAGEELATNDDASNRQSDSLLNVTAKQDGKLWVSVGDRFDHRGGEAFGYRLYVRATKDEKPDFELRLPADGLTLLRGGEAKLKVTLARRGPAAPVAIEVAGLPESVTVSGTNISDKQDATELVFKAAATARIASVRLTIRGTSQFAGDTISRVAVKPRQSPDDLDVDHLRLAVGLATPFKIQGDFESKYAARGATFVRRYRIQRGDFQGPITIRLAERQARHLQGVTGPTIVVPAGESEFDYPVHLPPWMEIGRTSRTCVSAVGEIEEPDGQKHRVSQTSHEQADQIIVLIDPGQLDVRAGRSSLVATRGKTVELPFKIGRGRGIEGPVKVELISPNHIRGVSADPLAVGSSDNSGTLVVRFADERLGPWNMPLTLRATATVNGHPYTAETPIEIVANP